MVSQGPTIHKFVSFDKLIHKKERLFCIFLSSSPIGIDQEETYN